MLSKVKSNVKIVQLESSNLKAQKTKWPAFHLLACTLDIFVEFCCNNLLIIVNKSGNL